MKKIILLLVSTQLFNALLFTAHAQDCTTINAAQLKSMLVNMGYKVKDISIKAGSEKYQVKHTYSELAIYIIYELSASTNFVWLTALLNNDSLSYQSRTKAILKQNNNIQPAQFYITDAGALKLGLAAENRGITAAILRRHIDLVCNNIATTKAYWIKDN